MAETKRLFNYNDPLILNRLLNIAEGREEFTQEEQRNLANEVLDSIEQDDGERERLIAERNADGRHPIG